MAKPLAETSTPAPAPLAKVLGVQGKVQVSDAGLWAPLRTGDSLSLGDTVRTQGSSALVLDFGDGRRVSLGHDEVLTLDARLLALLEGKEETGLDEAVDLERLAQALADGEQLDALLPAPAAGPDAGSAGSAGTGAARIELSDGRVSPSNGFSTEGLSQEGGTSFIDNPDNYNRQPGTYGLANVSINQDARVSLDLSHGFFDADAGQSLNFSVSALPEGLSFDSSTGTISGAATNAAAFSDGGIYHIVVTARDSSGAANDSVSTGFTLRVNDINDAPTVNGPIALGSVDEDGVLRIDTQALLAGASDIDLFDVLRVEQVRITQGEGSWELTDEGLLEFRPAADWHGDVRLEYVIGDGRGGSVVNGGELSVMPVNDAPQLGADTALNTRPGMAVSTDVLANDSDVDGDSLAIVVALASNGQVSSDANGHLVYTPNPGFFGQDSIEYTVSDGQGGEVSAQLAVNVLYTPGAVSLDVLDRVNTATPSFSGSVSGDVMGSVTVTVGAQQFSVSPDAEGRWELVLDDSSALVDGHYQVAVSATDILGATSRQAMALVVDALHPWVHIDALDTLGSPQPLISGQVGNHSGPLGLQLGDSQFDVLADASGHWQFTVPTALADGDYRVSVQAADGEGNRVSAEEAFRIDARLPAISIDAFTEAPGLASFSGSAQDTDGPLTLSVNGSDYQVIPDAEGHWHFTLPSPLADGNYTVAVSGGDAQGNRASASQAFVVDDLLPSLSVVDLGTVATATPLISGSSQHIDGELHLSIAGRDFSVSPGGDGHWQFQIPAEMNLLDGDYEVVISGRDAQGNSVSVSDQFVIDAVNHIPVISGDFSGNVVEDAAPELSATGQLRANGGDPGEDHFLPAAAQGGFGQFAIDSEGAWHYRADNAQAAIQQLADGEQLLETFSVTASDGVTVSQVSIYIRGVNDAPVLSGPLTASASEDAAPFSLDLLTGASDVDLSDVLSIAGYSVVSGNTVGLRLEGTQLLVDTSAYQYLHPGVSENVTFSFDVVDSRGAGVSQSLSLSIVGADDVPLIGGQHQASVVEDSAAMLEASGQLSISGGDAGENQFLVQTLQGQLGELSINAEGLWHYRADNAQLGVQSLSGTARVEEFQVFAADGVSAQHIRVVVEGVNDAPMVAAPVLVTLSEDAVATAVDLLQGATDIDAGEVLAVANLSLREGDARGLSVVGNQLLVDPEAYSTLLPGERVTLIYDYQVIDGQGGSVAQTATVHVDGADDVPTIGGDLSATLVEDSAATLLATGQLSASGGDAGEDRFIPTTQQGLYGEFVLTSEGAWHYSADNSQGVIQALDPDSTPLLEQFVVTNADGVTQQTVQVTIVGGSNEAPAVSVASRDLSVTATLVPREFSAEVFDPSYQDEWTDASGLDRSALTLSGTSDIRVSFISESAGNNNSFGWYRVNEAGLITDVQVLWQNTNAVAAETTVLLDDVAAGEIGFFLVQDGYTDPAQVAAIDAAMRGEGVLRFEQSGAQADVTAGYPILVHYSEGSEVAPAGVRTEFLYNFHASFNNLNYDGLAHTDVGIGADDPATLYVGFEDLISWYPEDRSLFVDWDLRDLVFSLQMDGVAQYQALVAPDIVLQDDGSDLLAASVQLTLARIEEQLALTDEARSLADSLGVSVSYDAATRSLSLEGQAAIGDYQQLLSGVQLTSAQAIDNAPRQLLFTVTDEDGMVSNNGVLNLNADSAYGGEGDDFLAGTPADDSLAGLLGDDILLGAGGSDRLSGGAGSDTFLWRTGDEAGSPLDLIEDFGNGDVLDFADLLQGENSAVASLDAYFDFEQRGSDTLINIDAHGDGSGVDMQVLVAGVDWGLLASDQLILQNLLDQNVLLVDA